MSPDPQPVSAEPTPIEAGSVIEFGPDPATPRRRGPRFNTAAWASALVADRRLVPLAAALGAVALFASLVSEWQVTNIDATLLLDGQVGSKALPTTIADLGAWGAGYLFGVFVLVATTVLVLFGPGPGRRYARLIALSTGGVLLALLAAVGSELGDTSRLLDQTFMASVTPAQVQLAYGRGLWCALFGVAATMVALILAGRPGPPGEAAGGGEELPQVLSWRRPREEEHKPDEPFDLTVSSAKPFSASTDDRDKGISG